MELETHSKLKDARLQNLLVTVLLLQIALWAVMGLSVLGVSLPIVQPLLGFVYLTFVPGTLVLTALRIRNLGIVETTLYSVGLSVTVVLSIGFVLTIAFNALNIIKPFSFLAVTSSVSFVVLVLCAVAYFRNRTHPKPLFNTKMSVPLTPTLFLCVIPFLAVFSTYLVNTYNIDTGQLFLWLILGIVALLIAFDKVIPPKLYPLAVFVVALTFLFQQTLISAWLTGADIQAEWSLANVVLNTGIWNPNSSFVQYNGMLSVVALAPIYSLISSLDLVWVFKLVYPVIFALVPVGLYQALRRQLNDKVAFLSCFFFVSFAPFYAQMTGLARQEIAELFFVLLILLLVSKEMDQRIQSALFLVFGVSLVVSHYGLLYIVAFFLFMMWLVLTIARVGESKQTLRNLRTKIGIRSDKQVAAPSPRSRPESLITIVSISIFFIASTAWYFYTAQGTVPEQVALLGRHIAGAIGDLFSPTYSEAANVVAQGPLPGILHRVNAYVNYLNVFFMIAGVCSVVFLKKLRFKLEFSYVVLATIALGFLVASVAVPYLGAALDWTRVFQITLFFLAPFLVIGSISIGEAADGTIRKVTSKLGFGNSVLLSRSRLTRLLAIYLVFFMLLSTGSLFAVTEGYQNITLSNQVDGLYSHQTIVGATWLASNIGTIPLSGKNVTIYHYVNGIPYNDTTNATNATGQITFNHLFSSAGSYPYYATFAGDVYNSSTSAVVNVNVGSNQGRSQAPNQAPTGAYSVAQTTTTLSASTTTPAVGQLVTFTATLTSPQVVYVDSTNAYLLGGALGLGQQAQLPFSVQNEIAGGSTLFLGTYNIQHNNNASLIHEVGVNMLISNVNVTPLISNRSLIYSNGGASVYSYDRDVLPPINVTALGV